MEQNEVKKEVKMGEVKEKKETMEVILGNEKLIMIRLLSAVNSNLVEILKVLKEKK